MDSNIIKNQTLNSLAESSDEDEAAQFQALLQEEIWQTTRELESEYKSHCSEQQTELLENSERVKLKNQLNNLQARNLVKLKKFNSLKEILEQKNREREHIIKSSKKSLEVQVRSMEKQAISYEKKLEQERTMTLSLSNMLENERVSSMILHTRMKEMDRTHQKITKYYKQVIQASFVSKNTMNLAYNQSSQFKNTIVDNQKKFNNNMDELNTQHGKIAIDIGRVIEKISKDKMANKEKYESRNKLIDSIQKQHAQYKILKRDNIIIEGQLQKIINKALNLQLQYINSILNRIGCDVSLGNGIDEESTNIIIKKYKEMQLQEQSFSRRFQELSELNSDKQMECMKIQKYLSKLQELYEENVTDFKPQTTFNQLRSDLNTFIPDSIAKVKQTEDFILKAYYTLVEYVAKLLNSTKLISLKGVKHNKHIQDNIQNLQEVFDLITKYAEIYTEHQNAYITEYPEIIGFNDIQIYIIRKSFFYQKFIQYFPESEELANKFKEACYEIPFTQQFLTPQLIEDFLSSNTAENTLSNLSSLITTAHQSFTRRGETLIHALNNLLTGIKAISDQLLIKIFNHYKNSNPSYIPQLLEELKINIPGGIYKEPRVSRKNALALKRASTNLNRFPTNNDSDDESIYNRTVKREAKPSPILAFKRRSVSDMNEWKLSAARRAHSILQEILVLDKKMKGLKFKEETVSKGQGKKLFMTPKLPAQYNMQLRRKAAGIVNRRERSRGMRTTSSSPLHEEYLSMVRHKTRSIPNLKL